MCVMWKWDPQNSWSVQLVTSDVKQLAESQAEIYRIFSHSNRIQIFWLLMESEMSVNDIAESIEASVQNTSQHLLPHR